MANYTVVIKYAAAVEAIKIEKITAKNDVAAKSMATMIFNKKFEASLNDAIIVVIGEDNKVCFVRLFGGKWEASTVKETDAMLCSYARKQFKVIFLDMYGFTRKADVLTAKNLAEAKVAASKMQKTYEWSNAILLCDDTDNLVSQKRLDLKGRMVWIDGFPPMVKDAPQEVAKLAFYSEGRKNHVETVKVASLGEAKAIASSLVLNKLNWCKQIIIFNDFGDVMASRYCHEAANTWCDNV